MKIRYVVLELFVISRQTYIPTWWSQYRPKHLLQCFFTNTPNGFWVKFVNMIVQSPLWANITFTV